VQSAKTVSVTFTLDTPMDEPPGPPLQVQVTPGLGSLNVSWVAPADNGGSPILRYRAEANPTCEVEARVDEVPGVTSYSCTINNLDPEREYTVTVVAINAMGESTAASAAAGVQPGQVIAVPVLSLWGLLTLMLLMLAVPLLMRRGGL
jgi:hypothetical protein